MIPDAEVERVRESADIVGVIGEYVDLKRAGVDFRGPCPFHQGTHRNFSVSTRKRMYYCFVCHESGDVFTFIQKRLGMEWPDAVRHIAAKMGIELHETRSRKDEGPDPRAPYWEANAAAAQYFQRILWEDDLGRPAREYLAQRSVSRELAEQFGLGYAPREIGLLRAHLNTLGIEDAVQLEAGLLARRAEEEELRPRFRARLIFPILDLGGRHVGFGGRLIGPGEPKYLNSPDSAVYSKGQLLYHLNEARLAARREERMVLVEGYFDAMRVASAGIRAVVAPLGTALTEAQAQLIKRYASQVFLLYDSDKAGLKATFRAGDVLLGQGCAVRVVTLPSGEDPDTFVLQKGREALEKAIAASIDVFDRKVQILERGGWFADLHKRRKAIDHLLPTIRACADPVTREIYVARAAEASGVDRQVLLAEAAAVARGRARADAPPPVEREVPTGPEPAEEVPRRRPARRGGPGDSAERELIRAMLRDRAVVERVTERFGPESFQVPTYGAIFSRLLSLGAEASLEEVFDGLEPPEVAEVQQLLADADAIQHLERTVEDSLARLELRALTARNREIDAEIRLATGAEKDQLLREKVANHQEVARLKQALENP